MISGFEILFAKLTDNQTKLFSEKYFENMFETVLFGQNFDFIRVNMTVFRFLFLVLDIGHG